MTQAADRFQFQQAPLLDRLLIELRRIEPKLRVRLNRNRRTLVSLRWSRGWTLSLHEKLFAHQAALDELPRWLRDKGRGAYPGLDQGMQDVMRELRQTERGGRGAACPRLPTLSAPLDLQMVFDQVHRTWFAHLLKPTVRWSRSSNPPQRHIRFGCYRRAPTPLITLHPRLNQPWVAQAFVQHVIFHELCHHAQACSPMRRELMHSRRFRQWEASFPLHVEARAWERAHLEYFLDGSSPAQSQD
jgi:hypothetical protein